MPYYSLPKLAADKGMNIKTLRGWVSKGILRHSAMTAGEQARYSDADFEDACSRSLGQITATAPRPVVIRGNGDVAAFCRKLKKQLRGGGKTAQPQKRRRRRAA